MSLFNFLKKKKQPVDIKRCSDKIITNFSDDQLTSFIDNAITVFNNNTDKEPEDIITMFERITGGDAKCAEALYNFIPMVLCEKLFPEAEYTDYYTIFKNSDHCVEHLLSNNQMYNVARKFLQAKLDNDQLSNDETYAVLAHSSSFDALNQALNGGSQLKDLSLSPCIFFDLDTELC